MVNIKHYLVNWKILGENDDEPLRSMPMSIETASLNAEEIIEEIIEEIKKRHYFHEKWKIRKNAIIITGVYLLK